MGNSIQIPANGGGGVWGSITGDIDDQLDLTALFNTKQNVLGYTPLNKAGDTMAGNLSMGGYKIVLLGDPADPNDAVNYHTLQSLAAGFTPLAPIKDPCLAADSFTAPPTGGSYPGKSVVYIVNTPATGLWAGLEGRALYTMDNGVTWLDILNRVLHVGDRWLVTADDGHGLEGGSFIGQHDKIAVCTNATPGSYAWSFTAATAGNTEFVNNIHSDHSGVTYFFNGTDWIQQSGQTSVISGTALTFVGNVLNVLIDGATISTNGSNQLTVLGFTGSLIGDVTGTQGATVVSTVGGSGASEIHAAEFLANAATNANTASTIVKRDSSGNFAAGTITANLTGNASGSAASFTGSLVGGVTGTQGATVVSLVGGSSAANVHTAELLVNTAQSGNKFLASPANGSSAAPSFRAIVSADIPTLNQNTSGTAANLSGTPALPNGTTATTQAAADNSTKLATTAYADRMLPLAGGSMTGNLSIKTSNETITADSDGGTITFNLATSNMHEVTLGGSRTLAVSGATVGQLFTIRLKQDSSTRTVTWFSGISWPNSTTPTLTAGGNKADFFIFVCRSAGVYDGFIVGQNL